MSSTAATRDQLRRRAGTADRGFTLIETALATIIIGVGVLAMVDAQQSFIRANLWSSHAAEATFLANEIRELTRNLPRHDPVVGLTVTAGGLVGWGPDLGETTLDDFDDIDDFDGLMFGDTGTPGFADGDLPGPVNAFGEVIPAITRDGTELGASAEVGGSLLFLGQAMRGWSQVVIVEKINPFDTSQVLADSQVGTAADAFASYGVDNFPLRVSVEVYYQAINDIQPQLMTTVTWIVP